MALTLGLCAPAFAKVNCSDVKNKNQDECVRAKVNNNANNINPLTTPPLFDFSGFLRTGVGDPRQVQLAVKMTF